MNRSTNKKNTAPAVAKHYKKTLIATVLAAGFASSANAYELSVAQEIKVMFAHEAVAADFDGDGDKDVLVAVRHSRVPNALLINDGTGKFTMSSQDLSSGDTYSVATGDFDNDGDIDFVAGNLVYGGDELFINDGTGNFTKSAQTFNAEYMMNTVQVKAHDLNGDGNLDLVFANIIGANTIWFGDGAGGFTDSGQRLGDSGSNAIAFGDIDNDGDTDIVFANQNNRFTTQAHNQVWTNDGSGQFQATRAFDDQDTRDVALGDMNNDGKLDVVVANSVNKYGKGMSEVFVASCAGMLTSTGQIIKHQMHYAYDVNLYDVDKDGDLDAFFAFSGSKGDILMLNDGNGYLYDSGFELDANTLTFSSIFEDFNNDGIVDLFTFNSYKNSTLYYGSATTPAQAVAPEKAPVTATEKDLASTLFTTDANFEMPEALAESQVKEQAAEVASQSKKTKGVTSQLVSDEQTLASVHHNEGLFAYYRLAESAVDDELQHSSFTLGITHTEHDDSGANLPESFPLSETVDHMLIPDGGGIEAPDDFTVNFWVKTDSVAPVDEIMTAMNSQNQAKPIVSIRASLDNFDNTSAQHTQNCLQGASKHYVINTATNDGTTTAQCTAANSLEMNKWQMVTFSYVGEVQRLYLNGTMVHEFTHDSALETNDKVRFNGQFGEIRIYGTSLAPNIIREIYDAGL